MSFNLRHRKLLLAGCLALSLTGCDSTATVQGTVTFDGQPVDSGVITFLPADGQGPVAGGEISAGTYAVHAIMPGEKIVQIDRSADVPLIRTSGDPASLEPEARTKTEAELAKAEAVRRATGNNSRATIASGRQILDVHLTTAK